LRAERITGGFVGKQTDKSSGCVWIRPIVTRSVTRPLTLLSALLSGKGQSKFGSPRRRAADVPKIRSDRALASSCTLARMTCEAGPARAAHEHENRKLARHARAHLSAPRRRGGAELSGESGNMKVRCHGEDGFWLAASAPAKYCLLNCTALRCLLLLDGGDVPVVRLLCLLVRCSGTTQHSTVLDHQRHR
jgi:hypothetical protein